MNPRLNLATANRVFIVEPQWNPSVENQAIARALRLGQKQAVLVTRYVTDQTVEQVSPRFCSYPVRCKY
jgi:SNF2 family DNA or RNA helicase